ncbi:MAG: ribosome biogenesis GTP-binding protein YihA/YsxC [Peptococcaceae bacterium]|jgi:GTP-binding protein|nr:ribosome biogenesis GTP-binding protein YihA/YsxC [Peptococcaceae bacterium]
MSLARVEYELSAVKPSQYPAGGLREIALAGRSNVGKSSLINRLANRKNLARTSNVPGKTRTLNFYCVDQSWRLVDLPGYGYAKVGREERTQWGRFIDGYLENRKELAGIVQLVDLRHPPTQNDRDMYEWIEYYGYARAVVATKADKIARGSWMKHSRQVQTGLGMKPEAPLFLFSAETGQGAEALTQWLLSVISA